MWLYVYDASFESRLSRTQERFYPDLEKQPCVFELLSPSGQDCKLSIYTQISLYWSDSDWIACQ